MDFLKESRKAGQESVDSLLAALGLVPFCNQSCEVSTQCNAMRALGQLILSQQPQQRDMSDMSL